MSACSTTISLRPVVVSRSIWGKLVSDVGDSMGLPSLIRRGGAVVLLLSLVAVVAPLAAEAQSTLRSSFPGRRIGGGTRGECSARFLANLVPANSVFAPGAVQLIGVLEGPTASPRPLLLSFAPYRPDAPSESSGPGVSQRLLPASAAGLVLIKVPTLKGPTSWESTYRCPDGAAPAVGSELDFVQSASPPAISLLLSQSEPSDQPIQAVLQRLQKACGKTLPLAEIAQAFQLIDALGPGWPDQLPVRCP